MQSSTQRIRNVQDITNVRFTKSGKADRVLVNDEDIKNRWEAYLRRLWNKNPKRTGVGRKRKSTSYYPYRRIRSS